MNFNFITGREDSQAGSNLNLITKQTFFHSIDGRVGYFDKANFTEMTTQMKDGAPALLKQYREFFNCVKEGLKITSGISRNIHKTNLEPYYYLNFSTANLSVGVTIYDVDRLGQFIKDYAYGIIRTDFTLEDLIQEATVN
ncbi:hypothetical protein [Mucilaginibacter sp. FT3.2]|uniref:hypothetical protein n=1 Tax=Mucilaginibacter sp. FT3.2 TaxID=2723090 RepID=UPI001621E4CF|nr:hypothetical protein [Mucilaginibacter sp. FT3.2]MBB6230856.1 hypothetical protein [Mucilaginibacter sp. FT3.2]